MKKKLLLFIASFSFVTSSVAQLEITKNISNISGDINDGKISVEVSGGENPYKFYWSNESTSLDSNFSEKLTEGVEYSVKITDANGLCDSLSFMIESESVQEKINNAFIPVGLDTSPISPSLPNLAVGVLEVLALNSLNCVLFLGKPIAVIHSWILKKFSRYSSTM